MLTYQDTIDSDGSIQIDKYKEGWERASGSTCYIPDSIILDRLQSRNIGNNSEAYQAGYQKGEYAWTNCY